MKMLQGNSLMHELAMKGHEGDEDVKKKRPIALKLTNHKGNNDYESGDKELAMITRKFKRLLKKEDLYFTSNSMDDEQANLCLMAKEYDQVSPKTHSCNKYYGITNDKSIRDF